MSQWRQIKDKCPLNLRHIYSCVPFGFGSQILNMITSKYSQLRKKKNTPWILIPLYWPHWGFSSSQIWTWKRNRNDVSFSRGSSFFFFLLFVISSHIGCFHPASIAVDTHNTQRLTEESKHTQEKKKKTYQKNRCTHSHTHAHTQRYIQTQRALFQDAVSSRTEATGNTGWILLCLIPSHCHDTPIYLLHPSPCWLSTTLARLSLCMYVCMMCVCVSAQSQWWSEVDTG